MVIITGASRGIGRYLFTCFKNEGIPVIGTYNSSREGIEEDIEHYHKVDISDYSQVQQWIKSIETGLDRVTLINCAGIMNNGFAHKCNMDQWRQVIEVNLIGTFHVIRCLLPLMRKEGFGRIINFSTFGIKLPSPGVSAYIASKAGLVGLTKSLATENGACGVTVNAINLGYVEMGMGVNDLSQSFSEQLKERIPSGLPCPPQEIYGTVKYIMETEYLNGAALDVNGGII